MQYTYIFVTEFNRNLAESTLGFYEKATSAHAAVTIAIILFLFPFIFSITFNRFNSAVARPQLYYLRAYAPTVWVWPAFSDLVYLSLRINCFYCSGC